MAAKRLLIPLCAVLVAACVQDDGTVFNPIHDFVDVSDDEEREIGMAFDQALEEQVGVIYDPVVAGFISDLGQSIVAQIGPQPYIYRFRVIEDPTLNAFAVPGGYIYFHSGTILAAGSIDELAGVMGHEIAHVKAHHYARMQQKSQIPDLLAGIAGMAAAIAAEEPGLLQASQAINVSLKLRFSREFEREADQLGMIFTTRAGYDPSGSARFFERIKAEQDRYPDTIPPYLFSHPGADERIAAVEEAAKTLHSTNKPDPRLGAMLREVQARLAWLIEHKRDSLPSSVPAADPSRTTPLLEEANRRAAEGDRDAALLVLARAESTEPNDPRVSFRTAELLQEAERYPEAIESYRRTIALDPGRALVFYKLGLTYKDAGNPQKAVYAFEQAARRAGPKSGLKQRTDWEIEKLTFAIVSDSGFAEGKPEDGADTPLGPSRKHFERGDARMAWWGRLGARFVPYADRIHVLWTDPEGRLVQDRPVKLYRKPFVGSTLELDEGGAAPGEWKVEVQIDDERIERLALRVDP